MRSECKSPMVSMSRPMMLIEIASLSSVSEYDTWLEDIQLAGPNPISLIIDINEIRSDTSIFELIDHWSNYTTDSTFVHYTGSNSIIQSTTVDCVGPAQRESYETCV